MHKHNRNFEGANRGDRRPDFENFDEAQENFEDVEEVHFRGGMWGFGPQRGFGRGPRGYWGGFGPQQFGGHGEPRQPEGHGHGHGGPHGGFGGWGGPGFRGFRGGFGPGFRGFGHGFGPGFGPGFWGEWGGPRSQRGWGGGPGFGFRGGWGGPGGHRHGHRGHHGQQQGNLDMKIAWLEQAQARIEERLGWVKQRLEELKAERARRQESGPQPSQPDQAPQQASFYADSTDTDITML